MKRCRNEMRASRHQSGLKSGGSFFNDAGHKHMFYIGFILSDVTEKNTCSWWSKTTKHILTPPLLLSLFIIHKNKPTHRRHVGRRNGSPILGDVHTPTQDDELWKTSPGYQMREVLFNDDDDGTQSQRGLWIIQPVSSRTFISLRRKRRWPRHVSGGRGRGGGHVFCRRGTL